MPKNYIKTIYNLKIGAALACIFLSGCYSSNQGPGARSSSQGNGLVTTPAPGAGQAPPSSSVGNLMQISSVQVTATGTATGTATATATVTATATSTGTGTGTGVGPDIRVLMRSDLNNGYNVETLCSASLATARPAGSAPSFPCLCRYSWQDINAATGAGINRVVETAVSSISAFSLICPGPGVWDSEIPEGKQITLTVKPNAALGNTLGFTSNNYVFTKTSSVANRGDFRDSEGRAIKNIFHYTCYDYFSRALTIEHDQTAGGARVRQTPAPPPVPQVKVANQFRQTNTGVSAQSYWYDFYNITSVEGQTNREAPGFSCPYVKVYKGSPATLRSQAFPNDSTISLALQSSRKYPEPVPANNGLDATQIARGFIGYAATPSSDGTCPSFPDSNGLLRRTFRLRRYVVNYPMRYSAGGLPLGTTQPSNTVYVLDRPVDKTGQDPIKSLTRLGPKPCPFSWRNNRSFRNSNTTALAAPNYSCVMPAWKLPHSSMLGGDFYTRFRSWPDGKKFGLVTDSSDATFLGANRTYCLANASSAGDTEYNGNNVCNISSLCASGSACSLMAADPEHPEIFNDHVTPVNIDGIAIRDNKDCPIYPPPAWNLSTEGALHIRPTKGFVPEFLEDTRFQACAFQSSNPIDPDIVVAYNGYQTRVGDSAADDPKQARGFYCARTYADPSWFDPPPFSGGTAGTAPGHCDSGRPHATNTSDPRYYIQKGGTNDGFANLSTSSVTNRTVSDPLMTAFAIMNEKSYACAFTYNPSQQTAYNDRVPLTQLVTPRSGCCQRCSGNSKSSGCSRNGIQATAANRGIHSLALAFPTNESEGVGAGRGAFYNKYGLPAFTMQATLLSSAPFQLIPNRGKINTSSLNYDSPNHRLIRNQSSVYGVSITTGSKNGADWGNDTDGTPLGCYDPSEDP